jgi:hypothetical protein
VSATGTAEEGAVKKRIAIILAVLLAAATLRTAYIFYQRRQPAKAPVPRQAESAYQPTVDDYVTRRNREPGARHLRQSQGN